MLSVPDAFSRTRAVASESMLPVFTLTWSNAGLNDAPAPVLQLASTEPFADTRAQARLGQGDTTRLFYGSMDWDGPPGIILPGQSRTITYYSAPKPRTEVPIPTVIEYTVDRLFKDAQTAIDWSQLRTIPPFSSLSDMEWDQLRPQLQRQIGTTNHDLLAALSRDANRLGDASQGLTLSTLLQLELVEARAANGNSVRGRIESTSLDEPAAGLTVTLQSLMAVDSFSTTSYQDGSFILTGVPAGRYVAGVASTELSIRSVEIEVLADSPVEILLTEVPNLAPVSFKLRDASDSTPVSQAQVYLRFGADAAIIGTSSDNGELTISVPHYGAWTVVVAHSDYAWWERVVVLNEALPSVIEIDMSPGASVMGRVVKGDGIPLEGAVVTVRTTGELYGLATSDENGCFAIRRLFPDSFIVEVRMGDGDSVTRNVAIDAQGKRWMSVTSCGTVARCRGLGGVVALRAITPRGIAQQLTQRLPNGRQSPSKSRSFLAPFGRGLGHCRSNFWHYLFNGSDRTFASPEIDVALRATDATRAKIPFSSTLETFVYPKIRESLKAALEQDPSIRSHEGSLFVGVALASKTRLIQVEGFSIPCWTG